MIMVLWHVMPRSFVDRHLNFGWPYCFHLQDARGRWSSYETTRHHIAEVCNCNI